MPGTAGAIGRAIAAALGMAAATAGPPAVAQPGDLPIPMPPAVSATGDQEPDLAERIRRLEAMNLRLMEQYEAVLDREADRERRYRELEGRYRGLLDRIDEHARPAAASVLPSAEGPRPIVRPEAEPEPILPDAGRAYPSFLPGTEPPLLGRLGEGFELVSPDEEFSLGVRVLNQVDLKLFAPNDLNPAQSGLYLPRTRFYFHGRLTRPIEYELSVQRSVEGVFDLLDGFVNFRASEGLQLKFGRSLVPYSYDWYDHLEPYFITPERALFPMNFGLSRQAGLTGWGFLDDGRLEYAVGGFSGGLAGLADVNSTREAVGYLNWRPFLATERFPRLRHLNLGGSIAGGRQVRPEGEPPLPLQTSIQATESSREAAESTLIFLDFEEDVRALGDRFQGALHLAYYGGGWSIESEFQAGRYQYARLGLPDRPRVPVLGYHVSASYFLTGEEPAGRTTVVPLRPFDPFRGRYGPGAIEPFARVSQLRLGREVFEFDLADERHWTRDTVLTDVGANWYLNRFVKFTFDWQHAAFGSPVLINRETGLLRRSGDLFWIRCQIWF